MKKILLIGMAALFVLAAGCESKEEKEAKAAQKAAAEAAAAAEKATADLLAVLSGSDTEAIGKALSSAHEAVFASLTSAGGSPGGDFSYDLNKAGDGIIIRAYSGGGGLVVIPETIEGYPVVGIGAAAFRGRYMRNTGRRDSQGTYIWEEAKGPGMEITAVVIPDGVKTIGDYAFRSIPTLHTVILPAGLETLGLTAFYECGDLYNLVIPEATGSLVCQATETVWIQPPGISSPWRTLGQAKADPDFLEEIGPRERSFTTVTMNGATTTFRGCGKLPLATRQRLKDLGYRGEF